MCALAVSLLAAGCVSGRTTDEGGGPSRDLAARPSSLAPVPTDTVAPTAGASATASARAPGASGTARPGSGPSAGAPGAPSAPAGSAGATTAPPPGTAAFHRVGIATDGTRDAGATTPGYGDIASVTVEDDGANARVTVVMAADVPARVPSNETMGVGVDLFARPGQIESDYQLFTDGEPDGWFAYLQTPKGFVRYPGTFGIGGRRLVFTVPWSALGGPRSGYFSAFADWTRSATPANLAGEDHAPNLGSAAFTR